jgi:hypothetical protein
MVKCILEYPTMTTFGSAKRRPEWSTALRFYWLASVSPRRFRMTHRPTILLTSSEIFFSYSAFCINWIFLGRGAIVRISSELKTQKNGGITRPYGRPRLVRLCTLNVPRGGDITANSIVFLQGRINPRDIRAKW